MKLKISLFLTVATIATIAVARDANVFASGLKATKGNGSKYNLSYTLNAPAQYVSIKIYRGNSLVRSIESNGKAKGHNSTTIDLNGLSGEYTWSVKAKGPAWATGEKPQIVIDKTTHPQLSFMSPRGIALDQDTESDFYGRIYVTETRSAQVNGRNTNVGIYVFDPIFSDVTNQGNIAYDGNIDWGPSNGCTRIFLNTDGKIYLSDWSDGHPGVWRADAKNLNANFQPVFGGTPYASGLRFNDDDEEIAGSISSCWVEGEGANTVLYTFDEDYVNNNANTQGIYKYNIGNLVQPWTDGPSDVIYDNSNNLLQNGNSVIIPQNGGWWISQTRWQDSEVVPSLLYVKNNEVLFNSGSVNPNMIHSSYSSAICLFDNGTKMAVSCYDNIKVFNVTFNGNVPTLTELYNITPALGLYCYSIAVDAAHNMYCAVDRPDEDSSGNVGVIALPVTQNICETLAPSAQKLTIDSSTVVPGDVNGDGQVTANDITALYSALLNSDFSNVINGDQNGDGNITSSDVTTVYNIMLGN